MDEEEEQRGEMENVELHWAPYQLSSVFPGIVFCNKKQKKDNSAG